MERKELPPWASGGRRVEVVNKAAIRVLAWKLWSTSTVVYEIGSSYQEPEGLGGQTAGMQLEQQEESVSFELKSGVSLFSSDGNPTRTACPNGWQPRCHPVVTLT